MPLPATTALPALANEMTMMIVGLMTCCVQLLRWLRAVSGRWLYEQLLGRMVFAQFMVKSRDSDIITAARRLTAASVTPMFAYTASEFHGGNTAQ